MMAVECGEQQNQKHIWQNYYPRYDFNYRKCIKCDKKQYIIDNQTFYDPVSNCYVDSKGEHSLEELVGYRA